MRQVIILIVVLIAFCGSLYTVWKFAEFNRPKVLLAEAQAMPEEFRNLLPGIEFRVEGHTPPYLQNLQGRNVHLVLEKYLNLTPEQAGRLKWQIPESFSGLIRYDWLKPEETDVYLFAFENGTFLKWEFQFRFDPAK